MISMYFFYHLIILSFIKNKEKYKFKLLEKELKETATIRRLLNPDAFQVWGDL